jgi:hypothetical protein
MAQETNTELVNTDTKDFVSGLGVDYKPMALNLPKEPKVKKGKIDDKEIEIPNKYVRCVSNRNFIAETIKLDGKNTFLIYQPNADKGFKWSVAPFALKDSNRYLPEIDQPYEPYTFSKTEIDSLISSDKEIPTIYELYNEILYIIKDFINAPDEILSLIANTILIALDIWQF